MGRIKRSYLRSVNQYIDEYGDIYPASANGNIDDVLGGRIGNIDAAPLDWHNKLSENDRRLIDNIAMWLK